MSTAKEILKIVPTIQSTALVGENVKLLKKKKKKSKDFVKIGVKNIIGTEFIKAESDLIGGFD
jgi:hypothetical protein